ncbi:CAP domain-containing protein [Nonomuraea sp. NPDC050310]|uniref:CAP domain-containing protein n=1 Tax=unclassified Nonomuraea TaxID=2593643 RepID=UPI003400CE46
MKRLAFLGAAAVLIVHASPAQAETSAVSAAACADADLVIQDKSAFPDTARGRYDYNRQSSRIEQAVLCLVNAERTGRGLQPVKRYLALRGTTVALSSAAWKHVTAAVRIRWWGTVAQVGKCTPLKYDPSRCDPHIDPETGTDPAARAKAAGYCKRGTWQVGENAYTGWGRAAVTPSAAVRWWMRSPSHRDTILTPGYTEMYTKAAYGSADPAASATPGATYVQLFGRCA